MDYLLWSRLALFLYQISRSLTANIQTHTVKLPKEAMTSRNNNQVSSTVEVGNNTNNKIIKISNSSPNQDKITANNKLSRWVVATMDLSTDKVNLFKEVHKIIYNRHRANSNSRINNGLDNNRDICKTHMVTPTVNNNSKFLMGMLPKTHQVTTRINGNNNNNLEDNHMEIHIKWDSHLFNQVNHGEIGTRVIVMMVRHFIQREQKLYHLK